MVEKQKHPLPEHIQVPWPERDALKLRVEQDGEEIMLPDSIYQALRQVIHMMASGQVISLVPYNLHLSTIQASDLLNVSRPYLYKLLDQGDIPYIKVGTHRRIQFQDLMQYKKQRDAQRHQALSELTELSQELGFYTPEDDRLTEAISPAFLNTFSICCGC
jgi:excisionase family DNA binding protein